MIVNPYESPRLVHKFAFAMDNAVLPSFPPFSEGFVLPARRKLYDIKVRRKVGDLIAKTGGINAQLFSNIEIETINRCNYDCCFCPASRAHERRPFKRMDERLFRSIIGPLRDLNFSSNLAMYSNNEPLLDPRAGDFCAQWFCGFAKAADRSQFYRWLSQNNSDRLWKANGYALWLLAATT